jgi:hypothetical protein
MRIDIKNTALALGTLVLISSSAYANIGFDTSKQTTVSHKQVVSQLNSPQIKANQNFETAAVRPDFKIR